MATVDPAPGWLRGAARGGGGEEPCPDEPEGRPAGAALARLRGPAL